MNPSDNYGYLDEYGNRGAMDQNIQINYPSHAQMFESDIEWLSKRLDFTSFNDQNN